MTEARLLVDAWQWGYKLVTPIALETAYVEYNNGLANAQARSYWNEVIHLSSKHGEPHATAMLAGAVPNTNEAKDSDVQNIDLDHRAKKPKVEANV